MILRYASCNTNLFAVHSKVGNESLVGTPLVGQTGGDLRVWAKQGAASDIGLRRSRRALEQWGWEHETTDTPFPQIRTIHVVDGVIRYVWEGETLVDLRRPDYQPLIEEDDRDNSIIPAGYTSGSVIFPSESDLTTLETTVENASVPAWATVTGWDRYADTTALLEALFRQEQRRCGIRVFRTIDLPFDYYFTTNERNLWVLLWMRSASRILYSHYGQTCIPLLLDKGAVDTNAQLSLS